MNILTFGLVLILNNSRAIFTSEDIKQASGDSWRDIIDDYTCEPYDPSPSYLSPGEKDWIHGTDFTNGEPNWSTFVVHFFAPNLRPPSYGDSRSVYQVNEGEIPWLRSHEWVKEPVAIFAGATLREFYDKVASSGGVVFSPASFDDVATFASKDNAREIERLKELFLKDPCTTILKP